MKSRRLTIIVVCLVCVGCFALSGFGQELKPIQLPEPKLDPSKSLAQALKERKTTREYGGDLSAQILSNLLWAAWGINRPDSGRRTAPSARNWQEIDLYVAMKQGVYLYDPKKNSLMPVLSGDFRSLTYTQVERFKAAPIHLVYISDLARTDVEETRAMFLTAIDTGCIAQNVYLYCASEGLPTGFRVAIEKEKLGQAMQLKPTQRIIGAQSVGLPPESTF
jgi:SagB-type dehydrogenase family enzyme